MLNHHKIFSRAIFDYFLFPRKSVFLCAGSQFVRAPPILLQRGESRTLKHCKNTYEMSDNFAFRRPLHLLPDLNYPQKKEPSPRGQEKVRNTQTTTCINISAGHLRPPGCGNTRNESSSPQSNNPSILKSSSLVMLLNAQSI